VTWAAVRACSNAQSSPSGWRGGTGRSSGFTVSGRWRRIAGFTMPRCVSPKPRQQRWPDEWRIVREGGARRQLGLHIGQHLREGVCTRQGVGQGGGGRAVAGEQRGQAEAGGAGERLDRVDARHRPFPQITPEAGIDPGVEAPASVRHGFASGVARADGFEQGDDIGGGGGRHVRRIAHHGQARYLRYFAYYRCNVRNIAICAWDAESWITIFSSTSQTGRAAEGGGRLVTGYARIHRSVLDHPAFRNDAEALAFAWLVLRAGWKAGRVRYKQRSIALRRGQLALSIRDFAAAMDRPKGWVERLFVRLRADAMIETAVGQGVLVVTICNYDRYQADSGAGETAGETGAGARAGRPPDTDKGMEESKEGNLPPGAAGGPSKSYLPVDWAPPPVADLPPAARACAALWSGASYAAHAEAFAGYWRGRRGRNADWRATWANRVVAIHGLVMRDEKFGRAPPDPGVAPTRPAMSAAERAAYLDRLAAQPWASAAPRLSAAGALP